MKVVNVRKLRVFNLDFNDLEINLMINALNEYDKTSYTYDLVQVLLHELQRAYTEAE